MFRTFHSKCLFLGREIDHCVCRIKSSVSRVKFQDSSGCDECQLSVPRVEFCSSLGLRGIISTLEGLNLDGSHPVTLSVEQYSYTLYQTPFPAIVTAMPQQLVSLKRYIYRTIKRLTRVHLVVPAAATPL